MTDPLFRQASDPAAELPQGSLHGAVRPRAAAYVAESSYFQADWQKAYWGPNYPRLPAVKQRYDPNGLFFVRHGVGSEFWSEDGFTRLAGR
jgi:FAD/FMN-containing dehydrogenase